MAIGRTQRTAGGGLGTIPRLDLNERQMMELSLGSYLIGVLTGVVSTGLCWLLFTKGDDRADP